MSHYLLVFAFLGGFNFACAQVAKTYYENGNLKSSVPLSTDGLLDGLGYTFYQTGEMAMETAYVEGKQVGTEREYYPDGTLLGECQYQAGLRDGWYIGYHENGRPKFKQFWKKGVKQGPMMVYFGDGNLRMFAMMQGDTTVFAQRFSKEGELLNEILKPFSAPIDTALVGEPTIDLPKGNKLIKGMFNTARIFIPGVPSDYISFFSPHGKVIDSGDPDWPLALVPHKRADQFVLYLRIKTHPEAQPIMLKQVRLTVQ